MNLGKRGNGDRLVSTHEDKRKRTASTHRNHAVSSSRQMDNELGMEWERREQEREDRARERERRDQHRMDKVLNAVEKISAKEFENSREIRAWTVKVILVLLILILVFLRFGYGVWV